MQESITFLVRVQGRRKESSRSLSHLLMSFLYVIWISTSTVCLRCRRCSFKYSSRSRRNKYGVTWRQYEKTYKLLPILSRWQAELQRSADDIASTSSSPTNSQLRLTVLITADNWLLRPAQCSQLTAYVADVCLRRTNCQDSTSKSNHFIIASSLTLAPSITPPYASCPDESEHCSCL